MIRAIPSNASDNVYCTLLAHSAIHGAMAGYSFTVGMVNGRHTFIPFYVSNKKTIIHLHRHYNILMLVEGMFVKTSAA
jgi:6-phosphofructokinase 1